MHDNPAQEVFMRWLLVYKVQLKGFAADFNKFQLESKSEFLVFMNINYSYHGFVRAFEKVGISLL